MKFCAIMTLDKDVKGQERRRTKEGEEKTEGGRPSAQPRWQTPKSGVLPSDHWLVAARASPTLNVLNASTGKIHQEVCRKLAWLLIVSPELMVKEVIGNNLFEWVLTVMILEPHQTTPLVTTTKTGS